MCAIELNTYAEGKGYNSSPLTSDITTARDDHDSVINLSTMLLFHEVEISAAS